MRVKLDENLPERLVSILIELGHDVDTVVGEGLKGSKDDVLWPAVQTAERFLITKDLGFADARRYPPGTHRGILVFRLSDDRSKVVAQRLASVFRHEAVADWGGCLAIVTDHKVRVRRSQIGKNDS
jgi:predicted nuclease of predicted toxin-antitoxin system